MEAQPSSEQLWRMIDSDDLSEHVHARIVALIAQAGGVTDHVVQAADGELQKAAATLRLRRTLLVASTFDPIRADAEAMIEAEIEQLAAIMPELLEARRAAVEQQQAIAKAMTEIHRIEMEGAIERQSIRNEIALDQSREHDEYMRALRVQADERHKKFMETMRGSRY